MQRVIAGRRLMGMDGTVYEDGDEVPVGAFTGVAEAGLFQSGGLRREPLPPAPDDRTGAGGAVEPWPMKTEPSAYLNRYPDGPYAALARQYLEANGAAE